MERILAVDTNLAIHEEQTREWVKYGIETLRVDTMNEAIHLLNRGEQFLFIAINEGSILNYLRQLPIMRDVTELPIFVLTTDYSIEKKIKAMNFGADVYEPFISYTKQGVLLALELLKAQNRRMGQANRQIPILSGGEIVLSQLRRKVFVKDIEVSLAKKEFDILKYLMTNSGCVIEHRLLMEAIWGDDYSEKDTDILWRTVNRIRTKLSQINPEKKWIKIERGVGYVFEF